MNTGKDNRNISSETIIEVSQKLDDILKDAKERAEKRAKFWLSDPEVKEALRKASLRNS